MWPIRSSLRYLRNLSFNRFMSAHSVEEKTALYDFHVRHGGKMVNFGGFLLPVQYSDLGVIASHLHTRSNVSIFDVSHMLQTEVKGKGSLPYLEGICTADLQNMENNSSVLTVFTTKGGGILDDLIITKISDDYFYIVSNASMKRQDQQILLKTLDKVKQNDPNVNVSIKFFQPEDKGLIAVQGPKAAAILQNFTNLNLSEIYFMTSTTGDIASVKNCRITRCGYTGEDGFEISVDANQQEKLVKLLLENSTVKLAGLAARDSLRLEAGLCLYGCDITQKTTPVEAALTWLIAKERRKQMNFPGAKTLIQQIKNGSKVKRVGLITESGPPARSGTEILDENETVLGSITSGCPSPSLGKHIAMGYVPTEYSKIGTKLKLKIRNKLYNTVITKMPFVSSNYYNKPK